MRKAKLTVGEFVEIPYYCFAPHRRGWDGWIFENAQVIKILGKNKYGQRVALLEVCDHNGTHGEHYEKSVCETKIFEKHDLVSWAQSVVDDAPASEFSHGRYYTEVYWLADKGLVHGLR